MPIRNCPIITFDGDNKAILLPIKILNPYSGRLIKTFGLIDTGASDCAIPAFLATMLGHDLIKGITKQTSTGNGLATAYRHTSTIIIYHPQNPDTKIIYTLDNVLIDCMSNLPIVLLGVNGFLSNFILKIDYPKMIFSLYKE
jgi:hypothetical protein